MGTEHMRLLLDTHVVMWLAQQPERVPAAAREVLEAAEERLISAVSAYEIAYKARLGKLPHGQALLAGWRPLCTALLAGERAVEVPEMIQAGGLNWEHRDPFDRMLVAQAQLGGLTLMTADARIRAYTDVRTVWADGTGEDLLMSTDR